MENKIYLVMANEEYGMAFPVAVFKDKQFAEKYCELKNEIDYMYNHFCTEMEFEDSKVDLNSKTAQYYSYSVWSDDDTYISTNGEFDDSNDDEQECRIDEGDVVVKWESTKDYVTVYSKNSYDEARAIALDIYKEQLNASN